MERTILHCDCNSFFASVELLDYPELRSRPVAVCGDPKHHRGVILAKNEAAKAFNVTTGEAVFQALRKCPQLVLLPPHHERYVAFSRRINQLYGQYTSQVEPFGIDESWLDVTDSLHLFGSGKAIADELRRRVREELELTISVGVSFCKIFAKLGSDYKKPDATTVISRENFREILYPLPAQAMLFVGQAAARRLQRVGLRTIGDLAGAGEQTLVSLLGQSGHQLYRYVTGADDDPVAEAGTARESRSIGKGMTFGRYLSDLAETKVQALWLSDQVAAQLRSAGLVCHTLQVALRNPQLQTITRQMTLERPTAMTHDLYLAALQLIQRHWSYQDPIRMLTITAQQLCPAEQAPVQLSIADLLHDGTPSETPELVRQEKLESSLDQIRQRFGKTSVTFGRLVGQHDEDDEESIPDPQDRR